MTEEKGQKNKQWSIKHCI